MPRIVRTARGVQLDFDTIIIKQQLAQAPMNIEVARRKEFIDSKEGKARGSKATAPVESEVIEDEVVEEAPAKPEVVKAPAKKKK
jgi:hypothetical protein